jgi:hypothetical protein
MIGETDTTSSGMIEIAAAVQACVLPIIRTAVEKFVRDLPELMKDRRGQWAIYHGAKLLGFGGTKTDLLQACYARGYPDDELYVVKIEEEADVSVEW